MRDRIAIKVIVWCIRHLPRKQTSTFFEAAMSIGARDLAVHQVEYLIGLLQAEAERQQRPNT